MSFFGIDKLKPTSMKVTVNLSGNEIIKWKEMMINTINSNKAVTLQMGKLDEKTKVKSEKKIKRIISYN